MYICPAGNRHQDIVSIFAAIKYVYIVKIKIYYIDLWMIFLNIITQTVNITAPVTVH